LRFHTEVSLIMMNVLSRSILFFSLGIGLALPAFGQYNRDEVKKKVGAIVAQAYKEADAKLPCRLKTSGKAKMGNWKDVENCVNPAHDLVDWESHADALKKIRDTERITREELAGIVESALTEQALSYDKVFWVKEKEAGEALLPLSNSLLKFLPEKSLTELPVYNKTGKMLGVFIGAYSFERSGGLEVLTGYSMANFQYTDLHGTVQTPGERFLVDSYGVPWRDARRQPGFRLPSNRLLNWR